MSSKLAPSLKRKLEEYASKTCGLTPLSPTWNEHDIPKCSKNCPQIREKQARGPIYNSYLVCKATNFAISPGTSSCTPVMRQLPIFLANFHEFYKKTIQLKKRS